MLLGVEVRGVWEEMRRWDVGGYVYIMISFGCKCCILMYYLVEEGVQISAGYLGS